MVVILLINVVTMNIELAGQFRVNLGCITQLSVMEEGGACPHISLLTKSHSI